MPIRCKLKNETENSCYAMIEGDKQNSSVASVVKTRISSVTADHVIYGWTFMASCVLGITGIQVDLNLELTGIHFPLTQPQSLFF